MPSKYSRLDPLPTVFVQVRSVCLSSDGVKVLVGTLGSDILELAAVEKQKGAAGEDDEEEEEQEEEQEEASIRIRANDAPK